ncbi:radical SAM protein [Desulfopila inferna]|uniref:radical SAM protein n=1 Tax=Desulfopila inferna TaxID=468528 RepID=UPI0019631839|nr:radical SAM protein [Desulfopila inferna]MBM9602835.1 B12-binding domain-containing radical SAM protein [Desulfopila inferna]
MQYEGNIIRPPSEANSIILQVTAGCSYNKCTFCGAYKDKPFRIRHESIDADIEFAAQYCRRQKRVFLADGDALILPFAQLLHIFIKIRHELPWVNRISLYANARAIRSKTKEELLHLKSLGLDRVYLGLESGDDRILSSIRKGETSRSMIAAADRITECALFLSVTLLLGIAGRELSAVHAENTGKVLTRMAPGQIAALTVMPIPGTKLFIDIQEERFFLPDSHSLLRELQKVIQFISLDRVQFYANHASNYLQLSGRLQKDKERMLSLIDAALSGSIQLIAEEHRAL